ncbi:MAG: DUF1844 domain-containing protein [bacterium]
MSENDIKNDKRAENEKSFKVIDKRKSAENENDVKSEAAESKEQEKTEEAKNAAINTEDAAGAETPGIEADFANFIYSLNTQALFFLGKIPNPVSKKYEKEIGMAKYLIDTIDMLSKKTKGNLDENEAKLIENILFDLRMAYISEKK